MAAYADIRHPDGRVLLVKSTEEIGDKWFLPGGGIEFGEDPEHALHREVEEETGLQVEGLVLRSALSDLFEWRGQTVHSVRLIYSATAIDPHRDLRHEAGGSTVHAEWVDLAHVGELKLARYVATALGLAR